MVRIFPNEDRRLEAGHRSALDYTRDTETFIQIVYLLVFPKLLNRAFELSDAPREMFGYHGRCEIDASAYGIRDEIKLIYAFMQN